MHIYPIFYKKLLELALSNAAVATNIKLKDNKYIIKEIKDLRKNRR
jgi:hypothetical protein